MLHFSCTLSFRVLVLGFIFKIHVDQVKNILGIWMLSVFKHIYTIYFDTCMIYSNAGAVQSILIEAL